MIEVLVVGGGVCGVRLAGLLAARGVPFVLAESRATLGGRVRTERLEDPRGYVDLGPAWVWPHQPRVLDLLRRHGVGTFEQYTRGRLIFQDERGSTRPFDMATMGGSLRIEGGMLGLVEALGAAVDRDACWLGAHLQTLTRTRGGVRASFADGRTLEARQVVLALPPRIAADTLTFEPPLPDPFRQALRRVPTWMAGHAKALAAYDTPWWREHGLNGDAVSHCGPLGELHDASPHDLSCGALFGFFARPAPWRRQYRATLEERVRAQLSTLYGEPAGSPRRLLLLDWAEDPLVATEADEVLLREHPPYGPVREDAGPWAQVLLLSGTETAPTEGGYIEGALAAAEWAAQALGG